MIDSDYDDEVEDDKLNDIGLEFEDNKDLAKEKDWNNIIK